MFACSLAVFESCESEACLNLSMLNRCCLGMRSCAAGLDGLASNAPSTVASTGAGGSWIAGEGSMNGTGSITIALASGASSFSLCLLSWVESIVLCRRRPPSVGLLRRRRLQGILTENL